MCILEILNMELLWVPRGAQKWPSITLGITGKSLIKLQVQSQSLVISRATLSYIWVALRSAKNSMIRISCKQSLIIYFYCCHFQCWWATGPGDMRSHNPQGLGSCMFCYVFCFVFCFFLNWVCNKSHYVTIICWDLHLTSYPSLILWRL